jgi:uncharacterized protein (DUF3820 family)
MDPKEQLIELIKAKMPFGKYKDRYLLELPEPYLVWFSKNGFPKGKLGDQLQIMHEIKSTAPKSNYAPFLMP